MAEHRDRTELREDLPDQVQHPNRHGASGPGLAVGMVIAAVLAIAMAVAFTIV